MIFVFGSNEAGIHGAGAARTAFDFHGAKLGVGFGFQGNSFAIPTKDWNIRELHINVIKHYVDRFIAFAVKHPELTFQITAIGTGLAGHTHKEMAELFKYAPGNCKFDLKWKPYLPNKKFWGTFI